jgi:hypothetical protein
MKCLVAAGILSILAAASAGAQDNCAEGVVYDDGSFENGYGAKPTAGWSEYVMRFDPPHGAHRLQRVCVCFTRKGPDSSLAFNLNIYSVGPTGRPDALLGSQHAFAFGVPTDPNRRFYSYDVSELAIDGEAPLFIGPAWSPVEDTQIFICADTNGPTVREGYANVVSSGAPLSQPINDVFPTYKALGLRANFDAPCQPNATTLCLNDNRFKVQVRWRKRDGEVGDGKAVSLPGREDSGLFWFFEPQNVELLIKVLDRCATSFGSYWVFFAATTDVGLELEVTDTVTGESRTYRNPVGMALPVQDTQAFRTCPVHNP